VRRWSASDTDSREHGSCGALARVSATTRTRGHACGLCTDPALLRAPAQPNTNTFYPRACVGIQAQLITSRRLLDIGASSGGIARATGNGSPRTRCPRREGDGRRPRSRRARPSAAARPAAATAFGRRSSTVGCRRPPPHSRRQAHTASRLLTLTTPRLPRPCPRRRRMEACLACHSLERAGARRGSSSSARRSP